jgi:hypothetical protein
MNKEIERNRENMNKEKFYNSFISACALISLVCIFQLLWDLVFAGYIKDRNNLFYIILIVSTLISSYYVWIEKALYKAKQKYNGLVEKE